MRHSKGVQMSESPDPPPTGGATRNARAQKSGPSDTRTKPGVGTTRPQQERTQGTYLKGTDPKFNHYRGYSKCRFCSQFVPNGIMDEHYEECPLVTMRCELRDTETDEPCYLETIGRALMQKHQEQCPMRTELCPNPGCEKQVSVRSMSYHLSRCNYEILQCETCLAHFQRSEFPDHERSCPEALIPCPLECGETIRRCDVTYHLQTTVVDHRDDLKRALEKGIRNDDPRAVYFLLVTKIVELENRLAIFGTTSPRRGHAEPNRSRSNSVQSTQVGSAGGKGGGGGTANDEAKSDVSAQGNRRSQSLRESPALGYHEPPPKKGAQGNSPPKLDSTQESSALACEVDSGTQLKELPENERLPHIEESLNKMESALTQLASSLGRKSYTVDDAEGEDIRQSFNRQLKIIEDQLKEFRDGLESAPHQEDESSSNPKALVERYERRLTKAGRRWLHLEADLYSNVWRELPSPPEHEG